MLKGALRPSGACRGQFVTTEQTPLLRQFKPLFVLFLSAALLTSCSSGSKDAAGGRGGQKGPTTVGFVVVQQGSAPIEQELPGRVAAFQVSEVRPQVSGVIL